MKSPRRDGYELKSIPRLFSTVVGTRWGQHLETNQPRDSPEAEHGGKTTDSREELKVASEKHM